MPTKRANRTPEQRWLRRLEVLRYIYRRQRRNITPTYKEISEHVIGLSSPSHAGRDLKQLEDDGYVELTGGQRSIRLTPKAKKELGVDQTLILGEIAAGIPMFIDGGSETVDLAEEVFEGVDFALRVRGDSMIDAGIPDGCLALLRKQETANAGEIVAVVFDNGFDHEATLKAFFPDEDVTEFRPANDDHRPIMIPNDHEQSWRIVGKYLRCVVEAETTLHWV